METTDYIWMNGEFKKWDDARVHVLTHALHYGSGAFEGIRFYKTDRGPAIFRLREHIERLIYSMGALRMQSPFSVDEICDACVEVVRRNNIEQGYLRPLGYYAYGVMGLNPRNAPVDISIACWPWGAYLPHEMVDIKTSSYIRIHPKSTIADAKICGHYVNSILAVLELRGTKYHEALFLDAEGNIAEGPGENFFIVKNGTIFTPPLGTILGGITRKTVMELAPTLGYSIVEKAITLTEAYAADEAFFTGTAAEVTPIKTIDDKVLKDGELGPVTRNIRDTYLDVVKGKVSGFDRYLTFIPAAV
jgi:branched-chain amino acid aminotransferase